MVAGLCSFCVELIQGIAQIGYFEMDVTLNNLIGALLGVLLYKCVVKVKGNNILQTK